MVGTGFLACRTVRKQGRNGLGAWAGQALWIAGISKQDDQMLVNRSAPHARVTPVLTVADVRTAVAWYIEVLGFVEHVRIGEGHRSQLGLPEGPAAELVLSEVRPGRRTPAHERSHQVMLKVSDVADVVERAVSRGARLVDPMHDWEYGERQATIDDPFGHQWVLNQTLADVAPEEWGGSTVTPRSSPG